MDKRVMSYFAGELTKEQRRDLLQDAFEHPELKKELMEAQQMQSLLALHSSMRDDVEGQESLDDFMKERHRERNKHRFVVLMRYAAVVIACVLCTWWITKRAAESHFSDLAMLELTVPAGQRAHLTLSDGTGVWVNAGSKLHYPAVFGRERRVSIEGEAFFEVAKAKSPFIVSAGSIDVKALGTKFNVFNYKGENMTVALMEGSVKVYESSSEKDGVVMQPNQLLTVTNSGFEIETKHPEVLSWRDGVYVFNKQPLGEILRKIELYYDVTIKVDDPAFLNYEYTGKFRQRDGVMEVLRIIQKIHPFTIEKHDEENEIILRH